MDGNASNSGRTNSAGRHAGETAAQRTERLRKRRERRARRKATSALREQAAQRNSTSTSASASGAKQSDTGTPPKYLGASEEGRSADDSAANIERTTDIGQQVEGTSSQFEVLEAERKGKGAPPNIARLTRKQRRETEAQTKLGAELLVSMAEGVAVAMLGDPAALNSGERELIEPSLARILARMTPASIAKVQVFIDPLTLLVGMAMWGNRLAELQAQKTAGTAKPTESGRTFYKGEGAPSATETTPSPDTERGNGSAPKDAPEVIPTIPPEVYQWTNAPI